MGGTQRLAAVAAVAHSRRHYNQTAEPRPTEASPGSINFVFASATLCGVLVLVCAACWRRKPRADKPEEPTHTVYTVSSDARLNQVQIIELPGPPPAYESVVDDPIDQDKDCQILQEVVTESRPRTASSDSGLPTYEAAVLLKDTKL